MSDSCFSKRIDDGVYDRIVQQFKAMGSAAFAGASYAQITSDLKPDFFCQSNNCGYMYIYNNGNKEFTTLIFGQICPASAGTLHCAKGNHYGKDGTVSDCWILHGSVVCLTCKSSQSVMTRLSRMSLSSPSRP
jgi:hypothetical protein